MDIPFLVNLLVSHIFISTSISKLLDISSFEKTISKFIGVNKRLFLIPISVVIIAIELIGGSLLLSPVYHTIASVLLIILLAVFGISALVIVKKGTEVICNCGGFLGNNQVTLKLPVRNMFLISGIFYTVVFKTDFEILKIISDIDSFKYFIFSEIITIVILVFYRLSEQILKDLNNSKKRGITGA